MVSRALALAVSSAAVLAAFGPGSAATASTADSEADTCVIQTRDGHYLTAVDGGDRTDEAVDTGATAAGSGEEFVRIALGEGKYAFRTPSGHYLTAAGGGGRNSDVLHTDASAIDTDETFSFVDLGRGWRAIRTSGGYYLTAVGGGGSTDADPVHSDARVIGPDEGFRIWCV